MYIIILIYIIWIVYNNAAKHDQKQRIVFDDFGFLILESGTITANSACI